MIDHDKTVVVDKNTGLTRYEFSNSFGDANAECCPIELEHMWPTQAQFGFDKSQYDALKLALTSKLALIQGYFSLILSKLTLSAFW